MSGLNIGMIFGAQYYRPPFPYRDCWRRDMKNMKELGFNTVKLWAVWNWIEREPGVFTFGDLDELLDLADKRPADIILLDCELPGLYIDELIAGLHALEPSPIVIVMSSELENGRKLLKAGADAFVSKADQPEWLLDTLHMYGNRIKK
jgi:CheY-like chemotaxis protein